jgi:glycine cleavage system aminomethyltransferase T
VVPCLALRVTYVGELGWELYCPTEFGLRLWDTLWQGGADHSLVARGYRAIDSLRLEKGYRVGGVDITLSGEVAAEPLFDPKGERVRS